MHLGKKGCWERECQEWGARKLHSSERTRQVVALASRYPPTHPHTTPTVQLGSNLLRLSIKTHPTASHPRLVIGARRPGRCRQAHPLPTRTPTEEMLMCRSRNEANRTFVSKRDKIFLLHRNVSGFVWRSDRQEPSRTCKTFFFLFFVNLCTFAGGGVRTGGLLVTTF